MPESTHLLRPPALRGNDPLGFLTAIGLVALAEQVPDVLGRLRLRWEGSRAPRAVYESSAESVEQLGERLEEAFKGTAAEGRAAPALDPGFPTPKVGSEGRDPMRMDLAGVQGCRAQAFDRWLDGDRWLSRWVSALVAPAAVHQEGYGELTAFYAPAGNMAVRRLFDKATQGTRKVSGPADALTSWQRLKGYQGANLDHLAVRTAEFRTDGKPSLYGAPSPTWLALQAIRMLPATDNGAAARTTGWVGVMLYPGYTRRSLVWPIWDTPLDAPAVRAILALQPLNTALADRGELEHRLRGSGATLRGLGIEAVFGASRRTADKGDGPLGPGSLLWAAE